MEGRNGRMPSDLQTENDVHQLCRLLNLKMQTLCSTKVPGSIVVYGNGRALNIKKLDHVRMKYTNYFSDVLHTGKIICDKLVSFFA